MRGGPGLGTIQPSQSDYFQAVKGGGHGDYHMIVLAPASVQDMHDFVFLSFELAFKYRTPVMMLCDGVIGQMMEKVKLADYQPRLTNEEIAEKYGDWATTGKPKTRNRNVVTSLELDPGRQEKFNQKLQAKYRTIEENEVRYEEFQTEDADYILVAYGSSSRICQKTVDLAREAGLKIGLIRPITLFPFPVKVIQKHLSHAKGFMSVEMSAGQMVEDVKLAVNGKVPVVHFGRMGGMIPSPNEVLEAMKDFMKQ